MTQEYYIVSGDRQQGPYDLVMLVRKIRNGSLKSDTQLRQSDQPITKPAMEWAGLSEFFSDKKDEKTDTTEYGRLQCRSLGMALKRGGRFFQHNQLSSVFSGVYILLVILITGGLRFSLPPSLYTAGYMASFFISYFLLSCYLFSVLRMTRSQPVSPAYMMEKILPGLKSLFLASLIVSLPFMIGIALLTGATSPVAALAGLAIIAVPGLFACMLFAFVPLLILDQGRPLRDAMEISRRSILKSGTESNGVLFSLFAINFIAALFALLPLVITLPITLGTLAEIYDESFSS